MNKYKYKNVGGRRKYSNDEDSRTAVITWSAAPHASARQRHNGVGWGILQCCIFTWCVVLEVQASQGVLVVLKQYNIAISIDVDVLQNARIGAYHLNAIMHQN